MQCLVWGRKRLGAVMLETVAIEWAKDQIITGRLLRGSEPIGVVLAHGAGTNQDHQSIETLRDGLADGGFSVLTFNYPYTEAGKRRPDQQAKLLTCHRAVLAWFQRNVGGRVILAGRSMGGRMGTYLAAEGSDCDGLILYAYPLHPAGRSEKLRKDHLPQIQQPMAFFVGTRDALSTMALYDKWIRPLPTATTFEVEDGDHSFRVRKLSGRTNDEAMSTIVDQSVSWLQALSV